MNLYRNTPAPVRTEKRNEARESLSFVVDLRDLGMHDAYRAHEVHGGFRCPVYRLAGPEMADPATGEVVMAGWIL